MNHPAASPQQKRLDAIRNRVALASPDWGFAADGAGFVLTAGGKDGSATIATIPAGAPFADSELILNAQPDLLWLLEAYTKLAERFRAQHSTSPSERGEGRGEGQRERDGRLRDGDFAANCAIHCTEPAFKKFLEEEHGLERPLTDDRVATKVRSILAIRSRGELNTDTAAAARWLELRSHFDAWKKR